MPTLLDRQTVAVVCQRYRAQVERQCRRLLCDPDEAADATQEVLLKLVTKGGDFRAEADWGTWLYEVSKNVCLNHMRNVRHRRHLLERHGDAVRPVAAHDPSVAGERKVLRAVLRSVSPKTARIAVYHHVLGMSQLEIAAELETSRQTVHKHLRAFEMQARRHLRRQR